MSNSSFNYKNLDRKTMQIPVIRQGLSIDSTTYFKLYTQIESGLRERQVLGQRVNTIQQKAKLKDIFASVRLVFGEVFSDIPFDWAERCLTAIAHKCNNNERRRRHTQGGSSTKQQRTVKSIPERRRTSDSEEDARTQTSKERSLLGTIVVWAKYDDGSRAMVGRVYDFVSSSKNKKPISIIEVDDLSFDTFRQVLKESLICAEDIRYQPHEGDEQVYIKNEYAWRACISEMYRKGLQEYTFGVKNRNSRSRRTCVLKQ